MPQNRIVASLLAGVVAVAAALAGCSGGDGRPATTAPNDATPAVPGSATQAGSGPGSSAVPAGSGPGPSALPAYPGQAPPAADNPPGLITCAQLAAAIAAGSLMTPGVVDGIANAAETADAPVADAARRLKNSYDQAVAAKNKANEPDAVAAVSAAASDMSGVCADSGLRTVG
jgi:hypothetical protein